MTARKTFKQGPARAEHAELITLEEAERRYNVSPWTIRRRIAAGELVAYKFGPRILRIDPADLEALFRPVRPAADDLET